MFSSTAEWEVFIRETLFWSALNASRSQRGLRDRLRSFRSCLVFFSRFRRFCDGDLKQTTSFFHIPHHPFTITSHLVLPLSLTDWILCLLPIAEFSFLSFRSWLISRHYLSEVWILQTVRRTQLNWECVHRE
jgi:hypothetical protein